MDIIHSPQGAIRSFKEFCVHLLTVIIGILIALSLEGLLEWNHHRALAQEARLNLASEICGNRARLEKGLASAPDAEDRLKNTMVAIEASRRNRATVPSGLEWSFGLCPLDSFAWESAAATGAVAYMRYPEVQQYTRVYLLQAQFLTMQERTLEKWLELQKWAAMMDANHGPVALTDGELGEIERDASAALIHTETEENFAKSLVATYSKAIGGR
jgi:hypothetical protein